MRRDNLVELRVALLLLGGGHGQAMMHCGCQLLHRTNINVRVNNRLIAQRRTHPEVPRVNLERVGHVARDTHELRKDKRAPLRLLLSDHELHRGRVHTVTQGSDDSKVRNRQQRVELVFLDRLVALGTSQSAHDCSMLQSMRKCHLLVMHRDEIQAPVLSIDVCDQLADLTLELGRVCQRRRCHLNEHDVTAPLRVVGQQLFKRAQLLDDTLNDIELVTADDDLLSFIQREQGIKFRLDTWAEADILV